MRSLAEAKHRPPALAEAMSDKDLKVFHVRNLKTGQETYISNKDFNAAAKGEWEKLGEIANSGDDRFMALTGKQAAEVGFADALISSREELKRRYGLNELPVIEPTGLDIAVEFLNWWLITGLLLIVGLTGLYMEAMAPGHAAGGIIGEHVFCFFSGVTSLAARRAGSRFCSSLWAWSASRWRFSSCPERSCLG